MSISTGTVRGWPTGSAPASSGRGDVQGVDDTGQVGQAGQEDVDEEVGAAAALEEDTQRRQEDGKQDLADVAGGERHGGGVVIVGEVGVSRRTKMADGRLFLCRSWSA